MAKGKKLELDIGSFNQASNDWQLSKAQEKRREKRIETAKAHQLHLRIEKRKNNTVTIVAPFFLEDDTLKSLLKRVKKSVGCGGSIEENKFLLQGDVRTRVKTLLIEEGYGFKQ